VQQFPVTFCRPFVEHGSVGKHKTMVSTIDPLAMGIGPRRFKRTDKPVVMRPIHIGIVFGCHNQDLTLHLHCPGVRRILGIDGEAHPVD
jgi:hypothetical protein